MAQMTWRATDELMERVRRTAERQGRSMNDYVTIVLDAATDPDLAGTEVQQLRERLDLAGILVPAGRPHHRPDPARVARARAAAGRGKRLSDLVDEGR